MTALKERLQRYHAMIEREEEDEEEEEEERMLRLIRGNTAGTGLDAATQRKLAEMD